MKKRGTRLTRAQKILIHDSGMEPDRYLCIKDQGSTLQLLNRETGKVEFVEKTERRKRR